MNYISLDLEFNNAFDFSKGKQGIPDPNCHNEVIQIGAVKLDESYNIIDTFNAYIKPSIYPRINPFISEVINMRTKDFKKAGSFEENFGKFRQFVGGDDVTFIVWGGSDIPILYENIKYYNLVGRTLILKYMDIQPEVSRLLEASAGQQVSLKKAIEALNIETEENFHNALNDAYYTARIFINTREKAPSPIKIFCSDHYKIAKTK